MKYIEKDIALAEIDDWMEEYPTGEAYDALRHVKKSIMRIPESDVRPVVRGKWMMPNAEGTNRHSPECSNCGRHIKFAEARGFRYCPTCGADTMEENMT